MAEEREVNLVEWSPSDMLEVTLNEPDDAYAVALVRKVVRQFRDALVRQ